MPETPAVAAYQSIPVSQIRPSSHQTRKTFDEAGLKALADSMKQEGLIQPITVRQLESSPNTPTSLPVFELVSGERRLRAAKLLGWASIDARIIQTVSEAESAAKGLVENLQREDLNPMEEAEGLVELNRLDPTYWTQVKIAEVTGKLKSHVSELIRFIGFSEKIKDEFRRRNLTEGHGAELLRLSTSKLQDKVADKILTKKLNILQTRAVVNQLLAKTAGKKGPSSQPPAGLKTDPLAALWPKLKLDLRMESAGSWTMAFKKGKWIFTVDSAGVGTQEALTTWFRQVAEALGKYSPASSPDTSDEPEDFDDTAEVTAMQKRAKLPKTPEEEAELYALAAKSSGPAPVYARLYGPKNLFTQLAESKTWADFNVTDPKEGLRQVLDSIRKVQDAKP